MPVACNLIPSALARSRPARSGELHSPHDATNPRLPHAPTLAERLEFVAASLTVARMALATDIAITAREIHRSRSELCDLLCEMAGQEDAQPHPLRELTFLREAEKSLAELEPLLSAQPSRALTRAGRARR
jgi:hypothetical protein